MLFKFTEGPLLRKNPVRAIHFSHRDMNEMANTDIFSAAAQISKLQRLTAENIDISAADIATWERA